MRIRVRISYYSGKTLPRKIPPVEKNYARNCRRDCDMAWGASQVAGRLKKLAANLLPRRGAYFHSSSASAFAARILHHQPLTTTRMSLLIYLSRRALAAGFLGLATLALAPASRAAIITWGAPTNISGNTDVSTTGTLVGAANNGNGSISSTTVNGVTFAAWPTVITTTSGIFSLGDLASGFLSFSVTLPASSLSASYQTLVRSGTVPLPAAATLTMSGLTAGNTYQFQWWSSVDNDFIGNLSTVFATATAGNSVTLDANTTNANGGLGQFVIGTFVADGATQVVTFAQGSVFNGMQLRQTGTVSAPDGGSAAGLLGLALAALGLARRRVARA